MNLQQATALKPFVGEFVPFLEVARRASQDKVADVIGGDVHTHYAANREGMFDVIDILPLDFGKLGESARRVVATIVLTLQLLSNLGCGMRSLNRLETNTAVMYLDSMSLWITFAVPSSFLPSTFWVSSTPLSIQLSTALSVPFTVSPSNFFAVFCLIVLLARSLQMIYVRLTPRSHVTFMGNPTFSLAFYTMRHPLAFSIPPRIKEFSGSGVPLLALRTLPFAWMTTGKRALGSMPLLFQSLVMCSLIPSLCFNLGFRAVPIGLKTFFSVLLMVFFVPQATTLFAESIKIAFAAIPKEIACCGEKLVARAFTPLAGDRIIGHDLAPTTSPTRLWLPGCVGSTSSSGLITPTLGNLFNYTFFLLEQKVVIGSAKLLASGLLH